MTYSKVLQSVSYHYSPLTHKRVEAALSSLTHKRVEAALSSLTHKRVETALSSLTHKRYGMTSRFKLHHELVCSILAVINITHAYKYSW